MSTTRKSQEQSSGHNRGALIIRIGFPLKGSLKGLSKGSIVGQFCEISLRSLKDLAKPF